MEAYTDEDTSRSGGKNTLQKTKRPPFGLGAITDLLCDPDHWFNLSEADSYNCEAKQYPTTDGVVLFASQDQHAVHMR